MKAKLSFSSFHKLKKNVYDIHFFNLGKGYVFDVKFDFKCTVFLNLINFLQLHLNKTQIQNKLNLTLVQLKYFKFC